MASSRCARELRVRLVAFRSCCWRIDRIPLVPFDAVTTLGEPIDPAGACRF